MTPTFLDGILLGSFLGAASALWLAVRWLIPKVIDEMFEEGWIGPGPNAEADMAEDERRGRFEYKEGRP